MQARWRTVFRALAVNVFALLVFALPAAADEAWDAGGGAAPIHASAKKKVVRKEVWRAAIDGSTGNSQMVYTKSSTGGIKASGKWIFRHSQATAICQFMPAIVTLNGTSVSFSAVGTATSPNAPKGYRKSAFTLRVDGTVQDGEASGTYIISFSTRGWPSSLSGTWTANRASGSGISPVGSTSAGIEDGDAEPEGAVTAAAAEDDPSGSGDEQSSSATASDAWEGISKALAAATAAAERGGDESIVASAAKTGKITVRNAEYGTTIREIYVVSADATGWGVNLLKNGQGIGFGKSKTFTVPAKRDLAVKVSTSETLVILDPVATTEVYVKPGKKKTLTYRQEGGPEFFWAELTIR